MLTLWKQTHKQNEQYKAEISSLQTEIENMEKMTNSHMRNRALMSRPCSGCYKNLKNRDEERKEERMKKREERVSNCDESRSVFNMKYLTTQSTSYKKKKIFKNKEEKKKFCSNLYKNWVIYEISQH